MRELLRSTKAYRAIASDAQSGRRSHAYLVLFPDETYLRALLRECAKAFFGAKDSSREAELIGEEMYSDCLYLPAAGAKLTVDDGARIVDESLLRPVEGDKKLFVLDNFHNASALVQNKLLKVLEEPPEGVHFLIGATAAFSVLPTVLSRVKKLEEPPFSEEAVLKALSEKYPGKDVRACAAASGGVFSAAELLLNGGGEEFRLAREFLSGRDTERLCRALDDKRDKRAFFSAVRLALRDMLFYREGRGDLAALGGEVRALAEEYPVGAILSALDWVTEAEKQLKFNANFQQCAEVLALHIRKEKEKWQKLS